MIVNGSYRVQCLRTLMGKMASDEHDIDVSIVAGMYAMFIVYAGALGDFMSSCPYVNHQKIKAGIGTIVARSCIIKGVRRCRLNPCISLGSHL